LSGNVPIILAAILNAHLSSVAVSQQSTDASSPLEKATRPIPLPATSEPSTAEERLVLSSSRPLTTHQTIDGPAFSSPLHQQGQPPLLCIITIFIPHSQLKIPPPCRVLHSHIPRRCQLRVRPCANLEVPFYAGNIRRLVNISSLPDAAQPCTTHRRNESCASHSGSLHPTPSIPTRHISAN